MKHRLVLLVVAALISIVGVGVGLVVLVWVLRRVLDANGKVVDELADALKRATGGGVGVDFDAEGVPRYIDPDLMDSGITTEAEWLTRQAVDPLNTPDVREAAMKVQAIADQLANPTTYLDHTDEFVPDEPDALFGDPVTIPPQEFIKDFRF